MCGICGFTGSGDAAALSRMMSLLEHRGPDDGGHYSEGAVSLGFKRLAIIDLKTGHQPMMNSSGSLVVVFNGEIFNYRELRGELERAGYRFETSSDTEVLLHGHSEWGPSLAGRLVGMFAYALYEPAAHRLVLARDPLGVKPMYYAFHEGRLVFASEPKAILAFHEFPRKPDKAAIEGFLTYLYVPGPATAFSGIQHLEPGCQLMWTPEGTNTSRYWQVAPYREFIEHEGRVLAELKERIQEAVRRQLLSDVPIGVFLSGGLDSSIIVNEMAKVLPPDQIKTATIGFEGHSGTFNELADARAVALHYGTDHTEFVADARTTEVLPRLCWGFDAPFANSSALPLYHLAQLAKRKFTVALSGVGGDELFAGYPRDLAAVVSQEYRRIPAPFRRVALRVASTLPESTRGRAGSRRFKAFAAGSLKAPEDEVVSWLLCFDEADRRELLYEGVFAPSPSKPEDIYASQLRNGFPDLLSRVLLADLRIWLPYNLLDYTDKMSMAHGVESRVPLLDQGLVEFAFRVHPRFKVRGLRGKWALRRAFAPELPRRVLAKRKAGFVAPLGEMYKAELKGLVGQILSKERIAEHRLFRFEKVDALLREHNEGRRDRTNQLTGLLMLDLWHKLYFERRTLEPPSKPLSAFY
jgi:asparagine synthase (glutamine-hydrolysing)